MLRRDSRKWWNGATWATIACLGAFVGFPASARGQGDVPAMPLDQPPTTGQASTLVKFADGVSHYLAKDLDKAKQTFLEVLIDDPHHGGANYYLGLIHLQEALDHVNARKFAPPEQRADLARAADAAFKNARANLQIVVNRRDPGTPLVALLDLGVAILGNKGELDEQDFSLAEQAAATLQDYVDTEVGRADPFGQFFLGIAQYRIGAYARRMRIGGKSSYLVDAERSLTTALDLARKSLADGKLADLDFNNIQKNATYYQGLVAIVRSDYSRARVHMEDVRDRLASDRSAPYDSAVEMIAEIEKVEDTGPSRIQLDTPIGPLSLEGSIEMSHQYDTNVILLGYDTALPRRISQQYDYRFGLAAGFDVTRDFTKDKDGILGESLYVGIGGTTSHLWGPHIKEFDINNYSGRAYFNWEPFPNLFMGIEYSYLYSMLGHKPFISSNRITPVISYIHRDGDSNERGRTDLYYSYDYRDYYDKISDPRLDRDGQYHAVGIGQSFNIAQARELWPATFTGDDPKSALFADQWLMVRLGYYYRNERTHGDEFDMSANALTAGVEVPLPYLYRMAFDFGAEFSWDDYSQPSLFDYRRNERYDFVQRYGFGLTYTLLARGEDLTLKSLEVKTRAGIDLIYQDSNVWDRLSQDVYSFDRQIYGLSLIINF